MSSSQFSDKVRLRACAVIVKNSSILLAKIHPPTRNHPVWMPPGGGVEFGETLEEALKREINEETNLIIKKKNLLWIHEFIEEPFHAVEFYFRCDITGGNLGMGSDPEIEDTQQMLLDLSFIPFSQVDELIIEPLFIKDFCQSGGNFLTEVQHVISQ